MTDPLDERERFCKERLIELQRRYHEEAKPWIDQLVAIQRVRPAPPIILTAEQASMVEGVMRQRHPTLFEVPPTQEP